MLASAGPVVRVFFCVRPKMAAKTSSAQLALCEQKLLCWPRGGCAQTASRDGAHALRSGPVHGCAGGGDQGAPGREGAILVLEGAVVLIVGDGPYRGEPAQGGID